MTAVHIAIHNKTYPGANRSSIGNIQLPVTANEFVCLIGPSGCGKTTLLNLVAGLDQNFSGEITLGLAGNKPAKIGYVFQQPRLLPWRTVRENIELVLNDNSSSVIDALLDAMQLTEIQHCYPAHLSLGMSRRVAIIRAFAIDPDLLLMDEPFVSLDTANARLVRELLLNLWQLRPHTVLFVTHDLREAILLADRLVFLSSSPMQIITEIAVPIARKDRTNAATVESFRLQLLQDNPAISQLL